MSTWPPLPYTEWRDTCDTLHMWAQIVGKTKLALAPQENHWWSSALYVTARGLTTSAVPCSADGIFDIEFDFIDHKLIIRTSDGRSSQVALLSIPVAKFFREYMLALEILGIDVHIWKMPVEVPNPIPFDADTQHSFYGGEAAFRFWQALLRVDYVFKQFRAGFLGKASPAHFWWGSFDHAVTLFSGRPAPERPGADLITREAYSHELMSFGFWPGNGGFGEPAFYAYAAPEPFGFKESRVLPASAYYDRNLNEFILKYEDVRKSPDPEATLLAFLESVYDTGARLAKWSPDLRRQQVRREVA
jgi:hypothetical protein